ncbi:MAG: peptidoglycan-binding protein [Proteobacteria bacterium]|nr:peptidoglycan-binding protein [Pseudomonadota bacterium]
MLSRTDLRQLAQRITARYHLTPLQPTETAQYLRHRWRMAGGQHFPFTADAVRRIHEHSGGVPRLINVIAERTLLAGYAHDEPTLHRRWVDRAAREALARDQPRWRHHRLALGLGLASGMALAAMGLWWWMPSAGISSDAASAAHAATAAPLNPPSDNNAAAAAPSDPPSNANAASGPATAIEVPVLDERTLSERLQAGDATSVAAWRALLDTWQLPSGPGDAEQAARCVVPVAPGILCARGIARLDKLATLGRPALLCMRSDGVESWALLLGIDAVNARLRLGGDVFDVDRIALEHAWTGEYATLWSAPAEVAAAPMLSGAPAVLATGARGALVDWVAAQLQPRYLAAGSDAPLQVDAAMHAAVREYQRARGLSADGVIGPETLMALSLDADGARLLRVLE